jgi:Lon protease-like protein
VGDRIESYPIFPLPLVLLPTEVAPLHIFEERYKQMVGECLESESGFGIVWLGDEALADVGCTVAITELLERMDDGRMNILVEGEQPFRLDRRVEDLAYPAGDVELLDDAQDAPEERVRELQKRYGEVVLKAGGDVPDEAELLEMDSYAMAATIELEPTFKQQLLDSRSEAERLDLIEELFDKALKRLGEAEQMAETARSNGKVKL